MRMIVAVCAALLALAVYYLYRLAPNRGRADRLDPFKKVWIAHRGLFGADQNPPENSLTAFERAVEAGYGIELDVQRTKDGKLVVFHDESLKRMCGVKKKLTKCSFEELSEYSLAESGEKIPLFDDVLRVIDGKVPLIVEIKPEGNWKKTSQQVAKRMDMYEGPFCVESFQPGVVAWFRHYRPEVLRGQLSDNFLQSKKAMAFSSRLMLSNLMMNSSTRPDFIAFNFRRDRQISFRICRRLFPAVYLAWTVRNPDELEQVKDRYDVVLFDSFIPSEERRWKGSAGQTAVENAGGPAV